MRFPAIVTYYGVRPDSSSSDHPTGHAVDLMLPNYSSNAALGTGDGRLIPSPRGPVRDLVHHRLFSHLGRARSSEGWRFMADGGSDTHNHKDHVHISFT